MSAARCEDYNTEPGVIYQAHSLPRCTDEAIVGWGNPPRWICQRHLAERLAATRDLVNRAQALAAGAADTEPGQGT